MTSSIACSISRMPSSAFLGQPANDDAKLLAHRRREAHGRLIEQEKRWVGGQCAHDLDHALLPAGQLSRRMILQMANVHEVEQATGALGCGPLRGARTPGAEQEPGQAAFNRDVQTGEDVLERR